MAKRISEALWEGNLRDGKGRFWTASEEVSGVYSFETRFEDREGTNPEELIGAAHASCYSMAFAADLEAAGYRPESIRTVATVTLDKDDAGFSITRIDLETHAQVGDVPEDEFLRIAEGAKEGCPISRALAVPIGLRAQLTR